VELEAALSNSLEARQVVFDLFQDLEGFSLDDYKPFSDVSSSLDLLVRFMSTAVTDRQQRLVKVENDTYDLVTVDGARKTRFTLNRETATSNDNVELIGLDHPLVQ
jgi:class 3 adenylate cyclase